MNGTEAEIAVSGIANEGGGGVGVTGPDDRQIVARRDLDLGSEAIEQKAFDERVARGGGGIDQKRAVAFADQEVEEDFALRRQQGRIAQGVGGDARYIVGDQPLQEVAGFGPGHGDHGAVVEPEGHGDEVMRGRAVAKPWGPPYWSPAVRDRKIREPSRSACHQ